MGESVWPVRCGHCRQITYKPVRDINRAKKNGNNLYCGRLCSGLGRRSDKSPDEKKAEKARYDRDRRNRLGEALLEKKRAAYHAEVAANPKRVRERQKLNREARRAAHAEYCRRPEYRQWKREYDRQYRADRLYGPFAGAFLALQDVEAELDRRASKYERQMSNGTLNKTQKRKREYEQITHSR